MTPKPKQPRKKNYNVRITAGAHVLVIGAKSEEEAHEFARNQISLGDCELIESEIDSVVTKEMLPHYRRHADHIAEDI